MLRPFKLLCAGAVLAGVAIVPTFAQAESAKPPSKSAASKVESDTKQNQASADDFEENRRLHMQKSKENNANKGAN
jgi:hypothetical protein